MRTLVLAIFCSLLFVVPCIADVSGVCDSSVVTSVFIDNQTPVNYGWVGIQSIETTIEGLEVVRSIYKEILKYDAQGRVIEYRETISEFGEVIETRHMTMITPIDLPQPSWIQRLGPDGFYSTQVSTGWAGYDATYTVTVKVTKLEYVPRRIWGSRGGRRIIPAYYTPLTDGCIASMESVYNFTPIQTSVSIMN